MTIITNVIANGKGNDERKDAGNKASAQGGKFYGAIRIEEGKIRFHVDEVVRSTVGPTTIELRQTTAKNMAAAGRLSGLVIQALRELGKEHVTAKTVQYLKRTLPIEKRRELVKDIRFGPD